MAKEDVVALTIRLSPKERLLAEKLAQYLHKSGIIKRNSINELIRYSIAYLGYVVTRQIERKVEGEELGEENE